MDNLISILIFSLPGLLAYFWIQMFGLNPSVKHSSGELVGLSALLWIPVSLINVGVMNVLADKGHFWIHMNSVSDIKINSGDLLFLTFYTVITLFSSFCVSLLWSVFLYPTFLIIINKIRSFRKIVSLDVHASIWDTYFLNYEESRDKADENTYEGGNNEENNKSKSEPPLIVEIYYLSDPDKRMYGAVSNMSRPFEAERALILQEPDEWKIAYNTYRYPVKRTYFDTKSGMVVNELEFKHIT
ncbi:hypothetical protein SIA70_13690 [Bacillus subtilis]|uniref:hypothetical protein n=1 Tax=Bacillus subtilis TaxID=1423 RepID=UPI0029C2D19A|nr:hypothetical protein [Bacillus subtilis]MDX6157158.1 hypothetical protein [Bacillus subtilis]